MIQQILSRVGGGAAVLNLQRRRTIRRDPQGILSRPSLTAAQLWKAMKAFGSSDSDS